MGYAKVSSDTLSLGARSYRLTLRGRACVNVVESSQQTLGSLSRYLHDVLMMCGTGVWFEQLRQFMPPRSLEESLHALLLLELIEVVDDDDRPDYERPATRRNRPTTAFGALSPA